MPLPPPIRRSSASLVLVAAFALSAAAIADPVTLLPGSTLLQRVAPDGVIHTVRYSARASDTASAARDLGLGTAGELAATGEPRGGMTILHGAAGWQWSDTLVVDRALAPVRERLHLGKRLVSLDHDGARVHRADRTGDAPATTSDTTFATPVFAFNQVDMLVRRLPAKEGLTVVMPLYSEVTGELERDTATVVAASAKGESGASVMVVRFADPAIVARYELDPTTRAIRSYETTIRASGAHIRRVPAD